MVNSQPKRRLEATLRPFLTAADAPLYNQLYSTADNTYTNTTPQNSGERMSYIVRPQRRPSFRSVSQRHRSGNSVFSALVLGEAVTANDAQTGLPAKDQYCSSTGLQTCPPSACMLRPYRCADDEKHDEWSCGRTLVWLDGQLQYKPKRWGVGHIWDAYQTRGDRKVYRPIERIPISRGWQYVEPIQPVYSWQMVRLPGV